MGCQHSASKRDEELATMSHDTYVTHHSQQSRNSRNSYCSVTSLTGPPMLSPKSGGAQQQLLATPTPQKSPRTMARMVTLSSGWSSQSRPQQTPLSSAISGATSLRQGCLRSHFLSEDYNDGIDMNTADTQYNLEVQAQISLYKHLRTGILVWRRALEIASSRYRADEVVLLFHYTTKGNFYAICNAAFVTPELWSALKAPDGGVHAIAKEPDQLGKKQMVQAVASLNSAATGSSAVRSTASSGTPGTRARYCVPILVPKDLVSEISHTDSSTAISPAGAALPQRWSIVCPDEVACLQLAAAKSEQRLRLILEARQSALGNDHPETLVANNDLAALIVAQGRLQEAEPLYRNCLQALENRVGHNHPDALRTACNLAAIDAALGDFAEAERLYRNAATGLDIELGSWHLDTLSCLHRLALVLKQRGQAQEALQTLSGVLSSCESLSSKDCSLVDCL
ncbi:KLC4 [Symbiodinium necroappetens]|uniref:KLC4 protein n=1 Tax=Symbiodinium necroappetens TaxID=1628268 RepID=A0A812Q879_9DINO|nr:KLC4 [Symbiodinium necroappetens]